MTRSAFHRYFVSGGREACCFDFDITILKNISDVAFFSYLAVVSVESGSCYTTLEKTVIDKYYSPHFDLI